MFQRVGHDGEAFVGRRAFQQGLLFVDRQVELAGQNQVEIGGQNVGEVFRIHIGDEGRVPAGREFQGFGIECSGAIVQVEVNLFVFVLHIFHKARDIGMDLELLHHAKASRALDQNVHAPIGKPVDQADHARRAPDVLKIVVRAAHDPKLGVVGHAFADQLLVSLLKNVQGHAAIGQQHHVERKQGKFGWKCHGSRLEEGFLNAVQENVEQAFGGDRQTAALAKENAQGPVEIPIREVQAREGLAVDLLFDGVERQD